MVATPKKTGSVTRTSCTKPYLARYEDGTSPGMYASLREAQQAIESGAGAIGSMHWKLDETMSLVGVETYVGYTF